MPRSGTKLLRDMLNRHPDVALFPVESHFFPHFSKRISNYGDFLNRQNFIKFYAHIERTMFFKNMVSRGLVITENRWFANLAGPTYGHVLKALFESYGQLTGCSVVGDKTPAYITEVPLILEHLPDARFVHIVRDPRDYVLSIRKAWNQDLMRATQLWKQSIRKFHVDLRNRCADYCEVRYEDLLLNTNDSLFRVCNFLELDFHEEMTVLEQPSENLGDARGAASIVKTNFGKWKTQLTDAEVRSIESIAGLLMSEFGYPTKFTAADIDISFLRMNFLRVKDTWRRFRFVLGEEKDLKATLERMGRVGRI
jgi:hypothetical protein